MTDALKKHITNSFGGSKEDFFKGMAGSIDGKVDLEKFKTGIKDLKLNDGQITALFQHLDEDGDGAIDFKEFSSRIDA